MSQGPFFVNFGVYRLKAGGGEFRVETRGHGLRFHVEGLGFRV